MHVSRWEQRYREGQTPWDRGLVDPLLVTAVRAGRLPPGRAIELGCGTGVNARYLAAQGFDVLAMDLAPTAIQRARAAGGGPDYRVHDVLAEPLPWTGVDLVFDRGCFHTFDQADQRLGFAARVAAALRVGGMWLSLIGSTEGPARDQGPPRRSAADVVAAVEPHLELVELRAVTFTLSEDLPTAWLCLSRRRSMPASPSTRRDAGPT